MTDAAVRWVVDRDDALRTRVAINDLHDVSAGVIVVHPRPTTRHLAHDVLVALSKDFRSPGWPGGAPRAWKLAGLWLAAEHVRQIVVYGAHRLTADDVQRLTTAASGSGATIWLLTCSAEQARRAPHTSMPLLFAACSRNRAPDPGEKIAPSRPGVVCTDADFVTFRASCYRLLGLASVRAVDERLSDVIWRVQCWIDERRTRLNRWDAGEKLEQLLGEARNQEDALVVIRATQLALFDRGYLLSLDAATICDATRLILNKPSGDSAANALRRMSNPALAALGALTACTPLDTQRLAGLRLDHIDEQGAYVELGRVRYDLPAAMRGLLRAQMLDRLSHNAAPDETLFVDRAGARCTPRRIRDLAQNVRRHSLAGRTPRHVERSVWHLGELLTVQRLLRGSAKRAAAADLPAA